MPDPLTPPQAPVPPAPPSLVSGAPAPLTMRKFGDHATVRQNVFANALTAAQNLPPIENTRYKLAFSDVGYNKRPEFSLADQRDAILDGRSLTHHLVGTATLTDKATNVPVDTRRMTLAAVPYLSNQGFFVVDGNPFVVSSQLRLTPGPYTRKTQAGRVETHVNLLPGGGVPHRIHVDPDTGVFKATVAQAEIPALALLRAMGATDDEVCKVWGNELLARNAKATKDHHLDRLYEKFGPSGPVPEDPEAKRAALQSRFESFRFDPWVTKRTVGKPYTKYDKEAALAITAKLLAVSRGTSEPDDRDHPAYSVVMGPEHLVAERLTRSKPLLSKMLWAATNTGKLSSLTPGFLTPSVKALFLKSGLANLPEGSSAGEFVDHGARITKIGEGGIGRSSDSVPVSARYVSSGQLPFIDLIRTSESESVGVDLRTAFGTRLGNDNRIYAPVETPSGRTIYRSPRDLAESVVAFPGARNSTDPLVPAIKYGKHAHVPKEDVDYFIPSMEQSFSPLSNLVPMKSSSKPHRASMGSRMITQSLALQNPESPLVRNGIPGQPGRSFVELFGRHMGASFADQQPGVVTDVNPDGIKVKYADGTEKTHELFNNFPSGRKSVSGDSIVEVLRIDGVVWSGRICDYTQQPDDKVRSIDPDTMKSAWMTITAFVKHRNDKQLFRVSTESGRSVVVTEDHSLITMGPDALMASILPSACVINKTRIPLATFPESPAINHPQSPRALTAEFGMFCGLYLAEGWLEDCHRDEISIAVKPLTHKHEVLKLMQDLFLGNPCQPGTGSRGSSPTIQKKRCRVVDDSVAPFIRANFGVGSGAKFILDWVYSAPAAFRHGLIAGYLAGDGCSRNGRHRNVSAASAAISVRNGMVNLIAQTGHLAVKATRYHDNEKWSDAYLLNVSKPSRTFRWFFYADKQEYFLSVPPAGRQQAGNYADVPQPPGWCPPSSRKLGLPRGGMERHWAFRDGVVRRKHLEDLLAYGYGLGDVIVDRITRWIRSDVQWDVVSDISPAPHEEYVYDFSVDRAEAFAVDGGLMVHNSLYSSYPKVQPGQQIAPGQILASSNYTDDKGHAAFGKNARVGFMPFKGLIYEDSLGLSQDFANEHMKSHHMYRHQVEPADNLTIGKTVHAATFPGKYPLETLKSIDDEGIVKKGTIVKSGDPLVLAIKKREGEYGRLSRSSKSGFSDASQTWDHDEPGKVVDVRQTKNGPVVSVETFTPTKEGDKLSGLFGNKGVTHIIPTHQMPVGEDGKPLDVILSSLGTISRVNQSAIFEAALGKIAAKTGNPYVIHDFEDNQNNGKFVEDELAKHGMNFMETVTDPETGRKIPNVGVGNMYLMKLTHMAAGKAKGRGLGGYDESGQPTRGGETGGMRSSLGDTSALISYGASHSIRDAHLARGQTNDTFWSGYMAGFPVKHSHVSAPFQRFLTELKAAGVNPVRTNDRYQLMGLKKSDIDEMAQDRVVQNGETLDFSKDNRPYPGGLMSPEIFGATDANSTWAKIPLHEEVMNPIFEDPARRLLGLTESKFRDLIAGKHGLPGGATGMSGLVDALRHYDVPKELESARRTAAGSRKTARDDANRKIGYLKYMDKNGTKPADWIWDSVPVLPPLYRPVTPARAGGNATISDPNFTYKELIDANTALKNLHGKVEDVGAERLNLYDAVKGVTGLGEPVTAKNRERGVKGILGKLLGDSGKSSFFQQRLLGSPVDLSGRGTVLPSPDLDMDEIGIPESIAWHIYHPFVVRRMVRNGVPRVEAALNARDKTDMAKRALTDEMEQRPVLATRYPVLHRYGLMGFRPRLVAGSAILSNNLSNKPLNLDHDGDTFTVNVPLTDEAVKETYDKLLPSKNLFSPATMRASNFLPNMEYNQGLHALTSKDNHNVPVEFKTLAEAEAAQKAGLIDYWTRVRITNEDKK